MASSAPSPRSAAEFRWDDAASRWRDAATGRFIPAARVREGVDALADYAASRFQALGQQYVAGQLSLADFQSSMLATIKSAQLAAALAAYGGVDSMTPARWGYVGQQVRAQYGYLQGFVQGIATGKVADARIPLRAALYGSASRLLFESVLRREASARGLALGRNVLHAKESCDQCKALAAAGWQPAKQIPPVGSRQCGFRCRCTVEYRAQGLAVAASEPLQFFNPHHDSKGRFSRGSGGKGGDLRPSAERAYTGARVVTETKLTKQQQGAIGERVVLSYLNHLGFKDARPLNSFHTNFPIDGVADHAAIEVKTGLVSNGPGNRAWRATIGQPGKAETAWLKSASAADKRAWNDRKRAAILDRKRAALQTISEHVGHPVSGRTMTVILNPDTKVADIYHFEGFHLSIRWNSPEAKAGYLGSFHYE